MLKFVSFLHLQNRHEKHSKIKNTNSIEPNRNENHNNNIAQHKTFGNFLHHKNNNARTSKEKSSLVSYLKFVDEQHAQDIRDAATTGAAAATATTTQCCSHADAGKFRRCSGNDRCATGTSCATARCCCCCTCATGCCCSSARIWTTSAVAGCCCTTPTRRVPFCRLSTGICPIRQQLQWVHGAAYIGGNVSALNCTDCCLPECLTDENDGSDSVVVPAHKQSSLPATCRPKTSSSLNCNNTCLECSSQATAQQPSSKLTTTTPSSILLPLTGFQMKLQHLTGAATNCC
ncbi:keratin-associated protein 10-7-like [Rhagoletis pomonella]|uniref:keratin-associated protein 10-7-like n=1 Tax=Rhagoletis pomonella TaxID=28610 RepID=UPI00177A9883|nr:keratin-associated protein 10-7-like [Rhagoletis pomonella]